jgi:glycine hydroxymethyltransferase
VVTSTTHKTLRGPRGGLIVARSDLGGIFNKQIFPGIQGGPLMHTIAAKAVAFKEALSPEFKTYQETIVANARVLADQLLAEGIALVSGGTDNHMMLVDLTNLGITGKEAETLLGRAGITVNKNSIPFETRSPFVTSGIRIGTPAVTTRGMQAPEMRAIGGMIAAVLKQPQNEGVVAATRKRIMELCEAFPLYGGFDRAPGEV